MAIDKRTKKIERKLEDQVFDVATMSVLHKLMCQEHITEVGGAIAKGKEANVYRAKCGEEERVVKIYRIETSSFKNMLPYLQGDPRFQVRQDKYSIIMAWAKKEFQNLKRAYKAGVSVPRPYAVMKNVLVMEYIGDELGPAPEMRMHLPENLQEFYNEVIKNYKKLYQDAQLVHGDASEFNVLVQAKTPSVQTGASTTQGKTTIQGNTSETTPSSENVKPVLIDFGQAVLSDHPRALELLDRDCEVLAKFFKKQGIETSAEIIKADIT